MNRCQAAAVLLSLIGALSACAAPAGRSSDAMAVSPYPASAPGDTLVVLLSGDGGWARLDKAVAADLARAGAPVAGVNALAYFRTRRTPQQVADDLEAVIETYGRQWGRPRILLVGYSFGADALPAAVPLLPPRTRARLRGLVLVSPGPAAELKVQPGDWFGRPAADAFPVEPLLETLSGLPMLCIQGAADRKSACARFAQARVRTVALPGGHHFDKAYGAIAPAILTVAP